MLHPRLGSKKHGVVSEEASRRQRKVTDVSHNEAAKTVSMGIASSVEHQTRQKVTMVTVDDVVAAAVDVVSQDSYCKSNGRHDDPDGHDNLDGGRLPEESGVGPNDPGDPGSPRDDEGAGVVDCAGDGDQSTLERIAHCYYYVLLLTGGVAAGAGAGAGYGVGRNGP